MNKTLKTITIYTHPQIEDNSHLVKNTITAVNKILKEYNLKFHRITDNKENQLSFLFTELNEKESTK